MKKITLRKAITDLADTFLSRIVEKDRWKMEDIVSEFHRATYQIALDYCDEGRRTNEDTEKDNNAVA